MRIKAICTDIDGTLLDQNREISKRTREAFAALPANFPVILASSRMPAAMTHLQKDLQRENNPIICYNGGFVIHPPKKQHSALSSTWIEAEICGKIVELARNKDIHISLYSANEWYAPQVDKWTEKEEKATKVKAGILKNAVVIDSWQREQRGAHKVMCMGEADDIQWLYRQLEQNFSTMLHLYRSKDTYIEIAPRSISKATGLELILKSYNIAMEEVMAFGDNFNDIELLKSVGLGIAVGNAREEVKAVARKLTAKSKADGVAMAIEEHLL
ncbi:Cof-type HAD-IIB family hydrolase [Cyclobacterium plantarum]|uniref:HAD family phosphatase n=1 Tax=Cyclobacterium plantarum TaxID=2716263 RepID=A0ABX0H7N7_9BACT|nr:Cof-type HAD-IIB family hydrolase [Cyclobacterium plantarum]NHE57669.1 HAD family phosphatase [Cyclobacterium plantarum]